jgi:hypothetical protein
MALRASPSCKDRATTTPSSPPTTCRSGENTMSVPPIRYTAPKGVAVVLPKDPAWHLPMFAHL